MKGTHTCTQAAKANNEKQSAAHSACLSLSQSATRRQIPACRSLCLRRRRRRLERMHAKRSESPLLCVMMSANSRERGKFLRLLVAKLFAPILPHSGRSDATQSSEKSQLVILSWRRFLCDSRSEGSLPESIHKYVTFCLSFSEITDCIHHVNCRACCGL
jgi:hypothetical protein